MSNFWARTITGLSMVFLLLASLCFSGLVFASVFLLITILGLWEFFGLATNELSQPQKLYGTLAGVALYLSVSLHFLLAGHENFRWTEKAPVIVATFVLFLTFILEIYRKKSNPLTNIAITVLGIFYIALPLSLLNAFSAPGNTGVCGIPEFITGYFILTWFYDTAAYLYGKQFGKHKFFERISPKKTWEGTIAGVIVTFITAILLSRLFIGIGMIHWLTLAAMIVVFGSFGDLVESLIKRGLNIKDSGNILPGHGGILDRFDTVLISAPFVFLYFYMIHTI